MFLIPHRKRKDGQSGKGPPPQVSESVAVSGALTWPWSACLQNPPHLNGTGPLKETPSSPLSGPSGNSSVSRTGPVNASPSVQNWSVNRPSVIPEHPKKQKITISIHNKLPVRQGQSQSNLHSNSLEHPNKPAPSSTITTSSAIQSTSSAPTPPASSKVPKQMAPREACSRPVMNGRSRLSAGVLVPYGAESSEESDEEAKGLGQENGLGLTESACSPAPDAEDSEASPHELREPVALNGATGPDSDPAENGLPSDGAPCPGQPALHSEHPFPKANGLAGKVSGCGVAGRRASLLPSCPAGRVAGFQEGRAWHSQLKNILLF